MSLKNPSILPGFGLSLGLGGTYMFALTLVPLVALALFAAGAGASEFVRIAFDRQVLRALSFSLLTALSAGLVNLVLGFIVAWSLARYDFWGKRLLNSLIDLPFALPTAVAGVSLAFLLSQNGLIGRAFSNLNIAIWENDFLCVTIALVFVGMPFVVRTLQPVIEELGVEEIEAAGSLGASFWQSFWLVIAPSLAPAALTGFALAFARGLGEYGSVIFVSSNIPFKSEILPVVIVGKLDSFDYQAASVVGIVMIIVAFALLLIINALQKWSAR